MILSLILSLASPEKSSEKMSTAHGMSHGMSETSIDKIFDTYHMALPKTKDLHSEKQSKAEPRMETMPLDENREDPRMS